MDIFDDDAFYDFLLAGVRDALTREHPESQIAFLKLIWHDIPSRSMVPIVLQIVEALCSQSRVAVASETPWREFVSWMRDSTPRSDWREMRKQFTERNGHELPSLDRPKFLDF